MPKGYEYTSSDYCTSMMDYQKSLVGISINSIEISAGYTSRTCSDSHVANQIVSAFSKCRDDNCSSRKYFTCQGNKWGVGNCGDGGEIMVGQTTVCSCSTHDVVIRPCIDNDNWGGNYDGCAESTTKLRIVVT